MSDVIEKVARAIVAEMEDQQLGSVSPWHDTEFRDNAFRCARAAVEALREPSEAMIEAAVAATPIYTKVRECWRAMIDALLAETQRRE